MLYFYLVLTCLGAGKQASKPTLSYQPPEGDENERPLLTSARVEPQGSDYALQLDFNREPWGELCKSRCANVTLFFDTDNNSKTGLKLNDPKAAETGADLSVTVQGLREYRDNVGRSTLKVRVTQFNEQSTSLESGLVISEMSQAEDAQRVLVQGNSVFVLVDTNMGSAPQAKKMRVVYHPPSSPAVIGMSDGLASKGRGKFQLFKDGKLQNASRRR
jgi:hypothetical protein